MKIVNVRDLGFSKCKYIAKGKNEYEILEDIIKHFRKNHIHLIKNISHEEKKKLKEMIKKQIY